MGISSKNEKSTRDTDGIGWLAIEIGFLDSKADCLSNPLVRVITKHIAKPFVVLVVENENPTGILGVKRENNLVISRKTLELETRNLELGLSLVLILEG